MYIVMISDQYPPIVGGTERQAEKLSRAMSARGHEVRVVTGRWSRQMPAAEESEGVRIQRVQTAYSMFGIKGLRKFGQDVFAHSLKRELEAVAQNADVFHVHFVRRAAAVALEVGERRRVPVLVKETSSGANNSYFTLPRSYRGRSLQRYFLSHLRHLAVLNASAEREYRELPFADLTIHRAFNGIDLTQGPPWNSEKGVRRILFLGRIRAVKGALTLLEAFGLIADRRPDWKLRFCGEGEGLALLRSKVEELSLTERCEIAGRTDAPLRELSQASLLVLPSQAEGMSNTLLEAMAVGVPAVATAVGANPEMLADGCGWLAPELAARPLAEAIFSATESEEEMQRRGMRAQERARSEYSIQKAAAHYEKIYRSIGADRNQTSGED